MSLYSSRRILNAVGVQIALVMLLTSVQRVAAASPAGPVDDLIEEGVRLRVQGRQAEALRLFQKAHAVSPSARTLAQIGLAEGSLHLWLDAEAHLAKAVASHDTPWIEERRNRDALEQALSSVRRHIGTVTVHGPAGAALTLDGNEFGRLPLAEPVRLAEGLARFEGILAGYHSSEVEVTVFGGRHIDVPLDMPLLSVPAAPPLPAVSTSLLVPYERSPDQRWKIWLGGPLLGVSAASLAAGITWLAIDGNPTCGAPSGGVCRRLYDTNAQGWIAIGAAAAAGITGGLLVWQGRYSAPSVELGLGVLSATSQF
jgi:hypothetical protein